MLDRNENNLGCSIVFAVFFQEHDMDFYALYTSVGLWNAVYVIMYAITNATKLMKYSTRSTEEIFALFICIAFTVDAFKEEM